MHKTVDSWHPHWNGDGWKLMQSEIKAAMEQDKDYVIMESKKIPSDFKSRNMGLDV